MASAVRHLAALVLVAVVAQAPPVSAQDGVGVVALELDDGLDDGGHRRRILALREELEGISLEGPDFAVEMGAQLVFYACLATTVGSIMEVFSQELSQRWRFDAPPWYAIGGAIAGVVLASIGVPLLVGGGVESGRRDRRRRVIEGEIADHEAALGVAVTPSPEGLTVALSGTF